MNTISNVLFWISNGLLVPVAVLLILFLIPALILAGGFFGEYFRRRTVEKKVSSLLDGGAAELEKAMASLPQDGKSPLLRAIRQLFAHRGDKAWCERLLANFEVEAEKELGHSRTLAKIGPMLGLMGTLIPMGPALVGLAAGDLA
ncbi:MAG: MotA/TolQ/ExbB proton channel family protein, partial [Bacteroidales bacterium]|nr:MotA/TolQ/ExbB proton channel family protein [Bacteroidales bacterium]